MDGEFRLQFSLKTAFAALTGIAAFLALAHWTHFIVAALAFACFLAGLAFRFAGPSVGGIACLAGLGLIALLTTLVDGVIPVIASLRGVLGAFAIAFSFAAPLLLGSHRKRRAAALAVHFAWLLFLTRGAWDPRKPFWRFYSSIERGMTQEQVDEQLRRQFTGRLPQGRYVEDQWYYCLDPNDGRYNAEIIWVVFRNGRVTEAHYSPD